MTAARLDELAVFAGMEAEWSSHHGNPQRTQDYADLSRCARDVKALREVAELASKFIQRLGQQNPLPHQSALATLARIKLTRALEAVEAAEVKP